MKIEEVDIQGEAYGKLSNEIGSVFNTVQWLDVYDSKRKTYGIFDKGGNLIGFFNLYFDKQKGLSHLKNPPFSPSIGLAFKNPSKNAAKKQSFDKSIFKLVADFIDKLPSQIKTISFSPEHIDMQPFIWKDYKVVPNYTYQLNLAQLKEEEINNCFSPERRNDIKKAIKDGIECRMVAEYSAVQKMVEFTYDRKGKSLKSVLLKNILSQFSSGNSFAFVSFLNETPIAASFIVYDKKTAYYLLGGYDPNNKHQGAGALAVSNAIDYTKKNEIGVFDFEGSMLPEVERYFRGFGGDLKVLFTANKASLPIESLLKFRNRSQF